jgi:methylmalonyl-CoA mutase
MRELPLDKTNYYFYLPFLSIDFVQKLIDFAQKNQATFFIQNDPIHQLTKDGNWFENLEKDFDKLNTISTKSTVPFLNCNATLYQNAGANMVQQLAITIAHVNEYFNRIKNISQPITIEIAVGTNYFFEIAKLRALRLLFNTLANEYNA